MALDVDDERCCDVERIELRGDVARAENDVLAREEPLELRVAGCPVAVVMRTPGHDEELVRGFLLTEGIVAAPGEIRAIRPCTIAAPPEAEGNVMNVTLADGVALDLARLRRNLYASSSCGICGKATLDAVLARAEPVASTLRVAARRLRALPDRLRGAQDVFDRTGGLHAAGLFDADGRRLAVREDVGRHNAVDKVVGWAAEHQVALDQAILVVSGRASFEIAQKALLARIPVVAAVSAPTSLAVDLCRRAGVTLIGFLRGERMCVYSAPERVT